MKRWFLLLAAAVAALIVTYSAAEFSDIEEFGKARFEVYLPMSAAVAADSSPAGYKIIGTDAEGARKAAAEYSDYLGISAALRAERGAAEKFFRKYGIREVSKQEIEGITTLYGYNPAFGKSVELDGRRVNVQAAFSDGVLTIGIPLIMGSY